MNHFNEEKSSQSGFVTTAIGEIPEEWDVAALKDRRVSGLLRAGGTPLRTKKEFYEGGSIPFVRIEDLTKCRKYLTHSELSITERGLRSSNTWIVPRDSILYSMYASFGEAVINRIPVATNQAIIAIVPSEKMDLEYLYYVLRGLKPRLQRYLRETTQKNLNAKIVRNLRIPLPQLSEQRKISSILITVDNAIHKTDEIIAKSRHIKKGLMQRLLTKGIGHTKFKESPLGEIPEEWEVTTIGSEFEIGTGGTPSRSREEYYDGIIPWLTSTELNYNVITDSKEKITEIGLEQSNATIYAKGTLLIAIIGLEAKGTRGRCAILGVEASFSQSCAALPPSDEYDTRFLFYYYQSLGDKIMEYAQGTKRMNLYRKTISAIPIPKPPMSEQLRIISILQNVDERIQIEKRNVTDLERIKKGLMQALLTGRVRVKVDPGTRRQ